MKTTKILGAAMALTLLGSTIALADDYDHRHHDADVSTHAAVQAQVHHEHWVRGHRFPTQYRSNQYIVTDWNARHLRRPPSGYRWYRADDQYVMVRRSNGVIGDIIDALR